MESKAMLRILCLGLIAITCIRRFANAGQNDDCPSTLTIPFTFKSKEDLKHALEKDRKVQHFFECFMMNYKDKSFEITTTVAADGAETTNVPDNSTSSSTDTFTALTMATELPLKYLSGSTKVTESFAPKGAQTTTFDCSTSPPSTSAPTPTIKFFENTYWNVGASTKSSKYLNGQSISIRKANYTCGQEKYSYTLTTEKKNYQGAKTFCDNEGTNLASKGLRNINIRWLVIENVVRPLQETSGCQNVWIGLDDLNQEADWVWTDGVESSKNNTDWADGEPNGERRENCAALRKIRENQVNDFKCNLMKCYLCEKVLSLPNNDGAGHSTDANQGEG